MFLTILAYTSTFFETRACTVVSKNFELSTVPETDFCQVLLPLAKKENYHEYA